MESGEDWTGTAGLKMEEEAMSPGLWAASFFLFFLNLFTFHFYLFLAALGLCCCPRTFSSCGERGLLFVPVCGLLIAVASWALGAPASVVVVHGLSTCGSRALEHRLSSCGVWA